MRRALGLLFFAACAPRPSDRAPASTIAVGVADGGLPSAPSLPPALGEVTVTFFEPDAGASWGPWGEPTTDAATAIRPCYVRALRDDPAAAGFVRVSIPGGQGGTYASATLVDHSPLDESLVRCVVEALRGLHRPEALWAAPSIAYVSLR